MEDRSKYFKILGIILFLSFLCSCSAYDKNENPMRHRNFERLNLGEAICFITENKSGEEMFSCVRK